MKIKWSKDNPDDGMHDLCGKFNGKYVDVCQKYDNTWSVSFNGIRIEEGIKSRDIAKKIIIKFLE